MLPLGSCAMVVVIIVVVVIAFVVVFLLADAFSPGRNSEEGRQAAAVSSTAHTRA